MNFEKLRNMESFTQKMFNNIIGFQERDHPAWDETAQFEDRIKNIPLHYLVFSNADRNPETHGPTINHYYPLHYEMAKIAAFAKKVSDNPIVLDPHARNGFVDTLLAREGTKVTGLRNTQEKKPNQIENFYDPEKVEILEMNLADFDRPVDMIFSSWMPSGLDITADIVRLNPKLVVYIHTDHVNETDGLRQTGTEKSFGNNLPACYKLIEEWAVTRPQDIFHEIWPDLTGNIEETRYVKIYANQPYHNIHIDDESLTITGYDWEEDLQMAETARAAMEQMKQRGFPVHF